MPKNTSKDTYKTRKLHFPQLETKYQFYEKLDFFRKSFIVPKKELPAQKTTFSQAKIRYESERVSPNEKFEKNAQLKQALKKYDNVLRKKQLFD